MSNEMSALAIELFWSFRSPYSHLADAVARAGLDLAALETEATAQTERKDAAIAENQRALETAGHWGVATMVFQNEPFFGQDRLELCWSGACASMGCVSATI